MMHLDVYVGDDLGSEPAMIVPDDSLGCSLYLSHCLTNLLVVSLLGSQCHWGPRHMGDLLYSGANAQENIKLLSWLVKRIS